MSKTVLTTDHVRDYVGDPCNIVLVQVCIGLGIAQFTFAFRSEPSFDKIFQLKLCKYWSRRFNFSGSEFHKCGSRALKLLSLYLLECIRQNSWIEQVHSVFRLWPNIFHGIMYKYSWFLGLMLYLHHLDQDLQ